MSDGLKLLLDDGEDNITEQKCSRFAVVMEGQEVWIQKIGNQLFIGVEVAEDSQEFMNLVVRPMATNLISLGLEEDQADDEHEHGPDCDH
ncbi:topoisomerase II [Pseudomonas sp. F1_0610]|uniref:topoisomerase II n=1 Tax=Pseudomonas sp. F1_0610 TaxID=3114284 RepID=UPI0039C358F5